ncbi:MAG: YggS family pyridoxal phosphate-dependent enzyme [Rhodospirillales bacterium]
MPTNNGAARLAYVRSEIDQAAVAAARNTDDVQLVCVSKTFDAAEIAPILQAGQRCFGENRVQEAADKWPDLKARYDGVDLHLIGPLQTNKVRKALELFDCIQTLDREKLAHALARERDAGQPCPILFIQVNTGEEPQKAGIAPDALDAFVTFCRDDLALPVRGLMCIPPVDEEPALHFALLRSLAERNGLSGLSMGMSADYRTAVRFGATHVRVGSAIFGSRPALNPA